MTYGRTASGKPITDDLIDVLAKKAKAKLVAAVDELPATGPASRGAENPELDALR